MNLRTIFLAALTVFAMACSAVPVAPVDVPDVSSEANQAPTESPPPIPPAAGDQATAAPQEVATFTVPGIDEASAKAMAVALNGVPGVVKAQPMMTENRMEVTFTPPQANPDLILAALQAVSTDATFVEVKPADPHAVPGHDCGNCPKKSCPHARKE